MSQKVSMDEIRALAAKGRLAMVIDGVAYDFTEFADEHPGGAGYLTKNKGLVATEEFTASHPVDIIERTLTEEQFASMRIGPIDPSTVQKSDIAVPQHGGDHGEGTVQDPKGEKPSIDSCINVFDFEAIARETVPEQGWVYYSSGADDEITLRENHCAFQRIWMRPRVLVNVRDVDMSTTILGQKSSMPLMLCAVAMCKLGHPDGEKAWAGASKTCSVPYMVPTLSGCSFDEIMQAGKGGCQYFQLYVNQDRKKTKKLVQRAEAAGCKALFITVDAPQLGNREKDRRVKVSHSGAAVQSGRDEVKKKSEGTAKALTTFIDPSLCWDDLDWFASITKMPIVLKGIASAEDAVMALEHGKVKGIMLSNHGGRQLDGARSAIEILPEVMSALRAHSKYSKEQFEVYIDGGIRRGTDIYKALALGVTAVGIGRPALYAMSAFGQQGVEKCLDIFKSELAMTMRLMGTKTLGDIKESSVITTDLARHYVSQPIDHVVNEIYQPKITQAQKNGFRRSYGATKLTAAAKSESAVKMSSELSTQPTSSSSVAALSSVIVSGLVKTVLSLDGATSLHRSAIFLVIFLMVHSAGLCSVYFGPDVLNGYGAKLREYPLALPVAIIEWYLLLSFAVHGFIGVVNSWTKRKFITKKPITNGKLALSAIVISVFAVVHVLQIRFGEMGERWGVPGAQGDIWTPVKQDGSGGQRDIHQQLLLLFEDKRQVVFYLVAVAAILVHGWIGWGKTVRKSDVDMDKVTRNGVIAAGRWFILVPVCVMFAASALYFARL